MKNSADLGGCYPPRPSASVDNTLLYLQNSPYPTQPHSIIANYTATVEPPISDHPKCEAYNLGHKGWKKIILCTFGPSHPCVMLTKHFHLTQVCILPFSNLERGNGGVDNYSVGITILAFSNTICPRL